MTDLFDNIDWGCTPEQTPLTKGEEAHVALSRLKRGDVVIIGNIKFLIVNGLHAPYATKCGTVGRKLYLLRVIGHDGSCGAYIHLGSITETDPAHVGTLALMGQS